METHGREGKKHQGNLSFGAFPNEYTIRLWGDPDQDGRLHFIDFEIIHVMALDADERKRFYQRRGATTSPDPVSSLDEAEAIATGFVKFSGCTQFSLDGHIDSKAELDGLLAAVQYARLAAANLLGWDIIHEYA